MRTILPPNQPTTECSGFRPETKGTLGGRVEWYGDFVRALATRFTASPEEARAAADEMFADIRRYGLNTTVAATPTDRIVSLIARRRLMQYLQSN